MNQLARDLVRAADACHNAVFLKKDAELAEALAREAYQAARHLFFCGWSVLCEVEIDA